MRSLPVGDVGHHHPQHAALLPGLGPPKLMKLVNPVARQVPRWCTVPSALKWVNEPLPMIVLAAGSNLPDPVTPMVSPACGPDGARAPFGPTRLNE
jgi:hypothetical protein